MKRTMQLQVEKQLVLPNTRPTLPRSAPLINDIFLNTTNRNCAQITAGNKTSYHIPHLNIRFSFNQPRKGRKHRNKTDTNPIDQKYRTVN